VPRILAVDDSAISRQIYSSVITPHCEVEIAEDAEQAWQKISNSHFDLVISDVNLPGISGLELLKKIKTNKLYSDTPIIIISGDGDGITHAKDVGADLWLLKPVNPESLVCAVKKVLKCD